MSSTSDRMIDAMNEGLEKDLEDNFSEALKLFSILDKKYWGVGLVFTCNHGKIHIGINQYYANSRKFSHSIASQDCELGQEAKTLAQVCHVAAKELET